VQSTRHFRILLQSRSNLFEKPGGDTFQILQLQEDLVHRGHECKLSLDLRPNLEDIDLVHCFNLNRIQETYLQVLNAKQKGKRVLLTPIFHNLSLYNQKGRFGLGGKIASMLSYETLEQIRNAALHLVGEAPAKACQEIRNRGYLEACTQVLESVDGLILSSREELKEIEVFFKPRQTPPSTSIPLGIETKKLDLVDFTFHNKTGLKDYILCVGRVEDLKNQLRIIEAMKGEILPLVFIGYENKHHQLYLRKFRKLVMQSANIHWFHNLTRMETLSAMKTARVHVLASMIETTGLANLEAGYLGANVVSTKNGFPQSVFKGFASYCDPTDPSSIRNAILKAYSRTDQQRLKEYIVENYTQAACALKHLSFYEKILSKTKVEDKVIPLPA